MDAMLVSDFVEYAMPARLEVGGLKALKSAVKSVYHSARRGVILAHF